MANEVYTQALGGVQTLVSAKAATRALNSALKAKGETPDTVDAEAMSRILLGPILSEFETILPPQGLKKQLRNLAASLRKNFPKVTHAPQEEMTEEEVSAEEVVVSADNTHEDYEEDREFGDQQFGDQEAPVPEPQTDPGFIYQTNALSEVPESLDLIFSVSSTGEHRTPQAPGEVRKPESVQNVPSAVLEVPTEPFDLPTEFLHLAEADAQPATPEFATPEFATPGFTTPTATPEPIAPARAPLSQEQLEAAVLRFAQLEHVKFVAALRADGDVAAKRGSGMDVDALAQLGLIGLKLLRRSGPLRTYYLAHTQGQLFLLPFGEDTLTLVGAPELNVGAVFNTLTSLKEER